MKSTTNVNWKHVGDAAHVLTMLSAAAFAVAVGYYAGDTKTSNLFDAQWKTDGFCIAGKEKPYWNSHDACLYTDVALAAVLGGLYSLFRNTPGMKGAERYVLPNIIGIVAHGLGHGGIASKLRELSGDSEMLFRESGRSVAERLRQDSFTEILGDELLGAVFWLGLIYASLPGTNKSTVAFFVLIARTGQSFIPARFGFTYVQTFLLLVSSFYQINRSHAEKDFFYGFFPALVGFPLTLVGWLESTQCSAFVRDLFYGHLVYDGYIAVGAIVFYLICYVKIRSEQLKEKVL